MKTGVLLLLAGSILFSQPILAASDGWHLSTGNTDSSANESGRGYENPNGQRYSHDNNRDYDNEGESTRSGNTNADVVVDMPPEVWTQGQNNQPPCLRCCSYQNRSYTEGSVVKMEGVLLQCVRDEKSFGTNNLIWQTVK